MRKIYLDNIRWATVLLVLIYHVCYMFNGVGVLGGIPNAESIAVFDAFACIVYPWFMVLLFVVAGMSARYALQKRTGRQFIRERAVKLLVPSTLGLFVIHWITGYLNIKIGGGLAYMPKAMIYPISAVSGIGPLWFVQLLFVFSCLLVLLKNADKTDKVWTLCEKANLPILLLLSIVIFGAAQVLNMPVLTMYRFGIYFVSFLIGYYVLSHDKVQDALKKNSIPLLCAAAACAVSYMLRFYGSDYTAPACLKSVITNLYLWLAVLAIIGCFQTYCNRATAFSAYMTKSCYGLYILHYPVLIVACYVLHVYFDLPPVWNYAIALVTEIAVTVIAYEAIRRIPIARYLVLGIRGSKTPSAIPPAK